MSGLVEDMLLTSSFKNMVDMWASMQQQLEDKTAVIQNMDALVAAMKQRLDEKDEIIAQQAGFLARRNEVLATFPGQRQIQIVGDDTYILDSRHPCMDWVPVRPGFTHIQLSNSEIKSPCMDSTTWLQTHEG